MTELEQPLDIGRVLRFAVLRRSQDGTLRVVDALPNWWSQEIGVARSGRVELKADFLIDFMCDAERLWSDGKDDLVASPFFELHVDGKDFQLQALAAKQGAHDLLMVRNLNTIDAWLTQTLRTARAHLLQNEKDRSGHRREVAEIAADRDEAHRLEQMKSEFLANMSHEIRTPLTTILGMASMAQEVGSPEQQESYLDGIVSAANRLLRLSNDILDLSRLQAERLKLDTERFSLLELLTDFEHEWKLHAEAKGLRFRLTQSKDVPVHVIGDEFRLRQVLSNLVNNAIKFTEQGSVEVTVESMYGGEHNLVSFSVKDTGVGIPASQQARIFDMFTQVDASSRRRHYGAGLGLAIAANLVHLMGGELKVESRLGQGSRFFFTSRLPRASASFDAVAVVQPADISAAHRARSQTAITPKALRVLVAEDHELNRSIIVETLRTQEYEIVEAENGHSAVEAWRQEVFDVVLMDCQMPIMSGLDAIAVIRREEREDSRTPIIALTAHAMREEKMRLLESGADGYLAKPFNRADLIRLIEEVTARGRE